MQSTDMIKTELRLKVDEMHKMKFQHMIALDEEKEKY